MRKRHIEFANTRDYGMHQVKLRLNNGEMEIWHNVWANNFDFSRMLDKCEIKSFEVSWEPQKTRKGPTS